MAGKAITTETIRETLFTTIEGVIEGSISPKEAQAVANLTDKILKTAELEMKFSETLSRLDADGQGITPGPMLLVHKKEP